MTACAAVKRPGLPLLISLFQRSLPRAAAKASRTGLPSVAAALVAFLLHWTYIVALVTAIASAPVDTRAVRVVGHQAGHAPLRHVVAHSIAVLANQVSGSIACDAGSLCIDARGAGHIRRVGHIGTRAAGSRGCLGRGAVIPNCLPQLRDQILPLLLGHGILRTEGKASA